MTLPAHATDVPTRERIVASALGLFAERGFKGTTVGQIEAAAGLAPRAGGFYKHFPSKEAVLEGALDAHDREIDEVAAVLASRTLGDLSAELELTARLVLYSLERERQLAKIVMKEGERFPELRDAFYDRFVRRGLVMAQDLVTALCERARVDGPDDARATATMLLAGLVGFRVQSFMFDRVPNEVDDDAFVAAWVQGAVGLFRSWGVDAPTTAGGQ